MHGRSGVQVGFVNTPVQALGITWYIGTLEDIGNYYPRII